MCVCLPHGEEEKGGGSGGGWGGGGGGEGRGLELRYPTPTSVVALSTNEVTEIGYNLHTRTHPRPGVVCVRCLRWPRYSGYNIYSYTNNHDISNGLYLGLIELGLTFWGRPGQCH